LQQTTITISSDFAFIYKGSFVQVEENSTINANESIKKRIPLKLHLDISGVRSFSQLNFAAPLYYMHLIKRKIMNFKSNRSVPSLHRRKFVSMVGLASAGFAISPRFAFAHNTTGNRKIRIAIVGGGFGSGFFFHEHPEDRKSVV